MVFSARQSIAAAITVAGSALLMAAATYHLDLVDTRPRENATVAESPAEIWLLFNHVPDVSRSGISLRGPAGAVELGAVEASDSLALRAAVTETLSPGEYTVSWMAAAEGERAVRGRYRFTVSGDW
jgi:methionine-rich copper-binding protein CopC